VKYTVCGFNQQKLLDYGLDIIDTEILRWFVDFYHTKAMVKVLVNDGGRKIEYAWVKYSAVCEALPVLGITNVRLIAKRFDKLCEKGIMKKHLARTLFKKGVHGTYVCFHLIGFVIEELQSRPNDQKMTPPSYMSNYDFEGYLTEQIEEKGVPDEGQKELFGEQGIQEATEEEDAAEEAFKFNKDGRQEDTKIGLRESQYSTDSKENDPITVRNQAVIDEEQCVKMQHCLNSDTPPVQNQTVIEKNDPITVRNQTVISDKTNINQIGIPGAKPAQRQTGVIETLQAKMDTLAKMFTQINAAMAGLQNDVSTVINQNREGNDSITAQNQTVIEGNAPITVRNQTVIDEEQCVKTQHCSNSDTPPAQNQTVIEGNDPITVRNQTVIDEEQCVKMQHCSNSNTPPAQNQTVIEGNAPITVRNQTVIDEEQCVKMQHCLNSDTPPAQNQTVIDEKKCVKMQHCSNSSTQRILLQEEKAAAAAATSFSKNKEKENTVQNQTVIPDITARNRTVISDTSEINRLKNLFEKTDKQLVFDEKFYEEAAMVLKKNSIGDGYIQWCYEMVLENKSVKRLSRYFRSIFTKADVVKAYQLSLSAVSNEVEKTEAKETCPVCGMDYDRSKKKECPQCGLPYAKSTDEEELWIYQKLYAMPNDVREEYEREIRENFAVQNFSQKRREYQNIQKKYGLEREGG
jgi:rubrerythrin